jgi:tape measure domain-containing protein
MKIKTYRRLEQLEQMSAKRASAQRAAETGPSAIETIRNLLRASGYEQQPRESLAEALARAMGITSGELRTRLSAGRLFA